MKVFIKLIERNTQVGKVDKVNEKYKRKLYNILRNLGLLDYEANIKIFKIVFEKKKTIIK